MRHRFAIVGCGRIAQKHAEHSARVGSLTAVCDTDFEKAVLLAKKYNANAYKSIENMLSEEKEIDVVCICTPNYLHAQQSILALKSGNHVLCEKPLSINLQDANEMIATANECNKKLFVVKQNRYNPPVEAVKSILKDNSLGKISSFQINCFWNRPEEYYNNTWKGSKKMDGGTLYTQFSHFIDLLYWFLGDVKEVKSVTRNFQHPSIETEDAGIILFEMKSGAIGSMNYNVNAFQKNMEGSFTIFGEKGTIKIGGQYLNTLEYQNIEGREININEAGNLANDYGYYQGSMSNHDKVYDHLINALNGIDSEFASAFDGMKSVEIIEMIYKNAAL